MDEVTEYRRWISLQWWLAVLNHSQVPRDDSERLSVSVDHSVSKEIRCPQRDFHVQLITKVLEGFVGITSTVLQALEVVLKALVDTAQHATQDNEIKTIVFQRYEYIPAAETVMSFVRVVSFILTENLRAIGNKKTETEIVCRIEYKEYEAMFSSNQWAGITLMIKDVDKKIMQDFVKKSTINCSIN
ncbi:hypothetical protein ASPZODRAFT_145931 [Penicilliopsis zonata CBS 506.65]|uniref:Uncharacterized protein n=1 Tax=Penicilliopsis zonata CBS 506.65 TaxID=1073090 RepID=A0A1L9S8U3_9EURO|nr:hypothetical protein ASPZODRAFT_145931 [Penicilliopsis zonata CBS 506.65]OJJ43577.1 hypothetical protein ASPZODRAFT_145931 [Penicilliopsis zonata CBS 506.65]